MAGNKLSIFSRPLIYLIFGVIVAAGILLYVFQLFSTQEVKKSESGQTEESIPQGKIVEIFSNGFVPNNLVVKKGDTVTFINRDTSEHWPASNIHPTHTLYPESGGCIGSKFDACRGLKSGESWSFTFDQKGTWGYHDHLHPNLRGTIIVE